MNDFEWLDRELDRREITLVEVPDRPLLPLVPEGSAEMDAAYEAWATSVERWLRKEAA